jgi:predicted nucleotidyltransferase
MVGLIQQRELELRDVCKRRHVARLDVFGSAANGGFSDDSDLDFLVTFQPLPLGQYADAFFGLLFDLEDLFGRKIDLVVESTVNNPYFRQELENTRELLYAA